MSHEERSKLARGTLIMLTTGIQQLSENNFVGEVPKVVLRFADPLARDRFASVCRRAFEPLTGPFGDRPECLRFAINGVSFSLDVGNAA